MITGQRQDFLKQYDDHENGRPIHGKTSKVAENRQWEEKSEKIFLTVGLYVIC